MDVRLLGLASLALLGSSLDSATATDVLGQGALSGCWNQRDSSQELSRRASDPHYDRMLWYCFDEGGAGQLVGRAAEFVGHRDETGSTFGLGDGWDFGGQYSLVGDKLRIALEGSDAEVCHAELAGDTLKLTACYAENDPKGKIEGAIYDRVAE